MCSPKPTDRDPEDIVRDRRTEEIASDLLDVLGTTTADADEARGRRDKGRG